LGQVSEEFPVTVLKREILPASEAMSNLKGSVKFRDK